MTRMASFVDELTKIALDPSAAEKLIPFVRKAWKPAAIAGGSVLTYHLGGKELEKYRLGRQVYEQMKAREE